MLDAQLEADFCLEPGVLRHARTQGSTLLRSARLPLDRMAEHRRLFRDHFEMRLGNFRGITLLCTHHQRVGDEITALLGGDAGNWVGDYSTLRKLNDYLTPYALQNSGTALFLTPGREVFEQSYRECTDARLNQVAASLAGRLELRWLTPTEIDHYRAENPFTNALGFSDIRPDVLVLAAHLDGEPIGMAGASADSALMYQIGIDVLPAHRNTGLATVLVRMLTTAVLNEGFLPFYGTSPSHIVSQRLALAAGYTPAWWEYVSSSLLDTALDDPR